MIGLIQAISFVVAIAIAGWAQVTFRSLWAKVGFSVLAVVAAQAVYMVLGIAYLIWTFSGVLNSSEAHALGHTIGREMVTNLITAALGAAIGGFIFRRILRFGTQTRTRRAD